MEFFVVVLVVFENLNISLPWAGGRDAALIFRCVKDNLDF